MNIKKVFPEISCFIENPKKYELLYFKGDHIHNEYALDVEEAKKIINYISDLEKENQKLKKQYCERTDCSGRIGNSKKVEELEKQNKFLMERENKLQVIEMKQKKFIKWLEDEIKDTRLKWGNKLTDNGYLDIAMTVNAYEEILQKYKKIIGGEK